MCLLASGDRTAAAQWPHLSLKKTIDLRRRSGEFQKQKSSESQLVGRNVICGNQWQTEMFIEFNAQKSNPIRQEMIIKTSMRRRQTHGAIATLIEKDKFIGKHVFVSFSEILYTLIAVFDAWLSVSCCRWVREWTTSFRRHRAACQWLLLRIFQCDFRRTPSRFSSRYCPVIPRSL